MPGDIAKERPVHFGGPVEAGRGFVLHTADYNEEATLVVAGNIAVTATLEILRAIGKGQGPRQSLFALGYAGWAPGQLDAEIQANGWLSVAADDEIIFDPTTTEVAPGAWPSSGSTSRCSRATRGTPKATVIYLPFKAGSLAVIARSRGAVGRRHPPDFAGIST